MKSPVRNGGIFFAYRNLQIVLDLHQPDGGNAAPREKRTRNSVAIYCSLIRKKDEPDQVLIRGKIGLLMALVMHTSSNQTHTNEWAYQGFVQQLFEKMTVLPGFT